MLNHSELRTQTCRIRSSEIIGNKALEHVARVIDAGGAAAR